MPINYRPNGLSFTTSTLGAGVYSGRVGVHAKNLASVDAVAGREFESLITSSASPTGNISHVSAVVLRHLRDTGQAIDSSTLTNVSVDGQGWIPVSNQTNGQNMGFTRDGTFDVDANLYLRNSRGEYVLAFPVNADGTPVNANVSNTDFLKPVSLGSLVSNPTATSNVSVFAQLPSASAVGTAIPHSIPIYDSLGGNRNLTFTWTLLDPATPGTLTTAGATQAWSLTVTDPTGAAVIATPYAAGMKIQFNGQGVPLSYNGAANVPPDLGITWGGSASPSTIALNLGALNSNAGVTSVATDFNVKFTRDGSQQGKFVRFEWDEDGYGVATFDNNTRRKVCRVPLGMFNNVNGLYEIRDGVFSASSESGDFSLTFAKQNGAGSFKGGTYEGSTTDATSVYVKMIEDQKRFMGNLKAISTTKEMLDRLDQI